MRAVILVALALALAAQALPLSRMQQQLHAQTRMGVTAWTVPDTFHGAGAPFTHNKIRYPIFLHDGFGALSASVGVQNALKAGGQKTLMDLVDGYIAAPRIPSVADPSRVQGKFGTDSLHDKLWAATKLALHPDGNYNTHWGLLFAAFKVNVVETQGGAAVEQSVGWLGAVDNLLAPDTHTEARLIAAFESFLTELVKPASATKFGVHSIALKDNTMQALWVLQYYPCGDAVKKCDAAIKKFDTDHKAVSHVAYKDLPAYDKRKESTVKETIVPIAPEANKHVEVVAIANQ